LDKLVWAAVLTCLLGAGLNSAGLAESDKLTVRVMTRNIDAGTDLNYLAGATSMDAFVAGALLTVAEVDASNIPRRAEQLAVEIAAAKPDLIALQEVTRWSIQDAAGSRVYDQLELLKAALNAMGQQYRVAALQLLTDAPVAIPGVLNVEFTDQNAILVRADLPPGHLDVIGTETHLYENILPLVLPNGTSIPVLQGWMAADVRVRGARFKFANTHLLSAVPGGLFEYTAGIQLLQAGELLDGLSATGLPIILAGDFNSDAEIPQHDPDRTLTAGQISGSGYTDVWHYLYPSDTGYTWPLFLEDQPPPNINPLAVPFERIDLVFSRGPEPVLAERTGTGPGPQGVYASDHVGVVAVFELENHRPDVPTARR
jgi:endonuclease/exonuclease/phosphatase family metal-dependent hydrolase